MSAIQTYAHTRHTLFVCGPVISVTAQQSALKLEVCVGQRMVIFRSRAPDP